MQNTTITLGNARSLSAHPGAVAIFQPPLRTFRSYIYCGSLYFRFFLSLTLKQSRQQNAQSLMNAQRSVVTA